MDTNTTFSGGQSMGYFNALVKHAGGEIDGSGPSMQALDTDVASLDLEHGALITIRDVDYKVSNPRPDGTGWTLFLLERA
jgi:hypothetical protein